MKRHVLILILISTLLLSACNTGTNNTTNVKNPPTANEKVEDKVERPNFTKETFPKVDGSTATIPLSQAIASNLLSMTQDEAVNFIKHNTTHNAYLNLFDKKADIIFVTEPSKDELNMAKVAKVELEIVPVVKEGFVFLVNTSNPVNSLTTKQIQDIYGGKIKNWKELGGEDKDIIAYQREANSGSQTLMEQLVMKDNKLADSPTTIVTGMEGLIESIAKYDNSDKALGYSVFYYAKTMYNKDTIKLLAVDGITPDNNNISSGKYPFTTSYYAVLRKSEPKDSNARKLLAWLIGADGQKLAEDAGYVPLEER
jgi:phosphate transport system substrate-binding protein